MGGRLAAKWPKGISNIGIPPDPGPKNTEKHTQKGAIWVQQNNIKKKMPNVIRSRGPLASPKAVTNQSTHDMAAKNGVLETR